MCLQVILAVPAAHPDPGPWETLGYPRCWFLFSHLSSEANTSHCVILPCSEHTDCTIVVHQALGTQADVAPDLRRHSPLNPSSIRQPGPLSSLFKFRELRLRVRCRSVVAQLALCSLQFDRETCFRSLLVASVSGP